MPSWSTTKSKINREIPKYTKIKINFTFTLAKIFFKNKNYLFPITFVLLKCSLKFVIELFAFCYKKVMFLFYNNNLTRLKETWDIFK